MCTFLPISTGPSCGKRNASGCLGYSGLKKETIKECEVCSDGNCTNCLEAAQITENCLGSVQVFLNVVADQPTENGYTYPSAVLEQAVEEYQRKIETCTSLGTFNSLYYEGLLLQEASHLVKVLRLQGDGSLYVEIDPLDNENGKLLQRLITQQPDSTYFTLSGLGLVEDGVVRKFKLEQVAFVVPDESMATVNEDKLEEVAVECPVCEDGTCVDCLEWNLRYDAQHVMAEKW